MNDRENPFEIGFQAIMGAVVAIVFVVVAFFLLGGIFRILAWAAPFLLIAAVIVNYRTVVNYLRWLWRLLQRNILGGLLAVLLTVVGFPVVAAYLFGRSFLDRRIRQMMIDKEPREQYIEYEDITDEDILDLEAPEKRKDRMQRND